MKGTKTKIFPRVYRGLSPQGWGRLCCHLHVTRKKKKWEVLRWYLTKLLYAQYFSGTENVGYTETPTAPFQHTKFFDRLLQVGERESDNVKLNFLLVLVWCCGCDPDDWFTMTEVGYPGFGDAFFVLHHRYGSSSSHGALSATEVFAVGSLWTRGPGSTAPNKNKQIKNYKKNGCCIFPLHLRKGFKP